MRAVLFAGGWEGHSPIAFSNWCKKLLEDNNVEVEVFETLETLKNPEELGDVDLIIPIWSSARSSHQLEFGNMTKLQEDGLIRLIANGCGLAGWHGQWVTHLETDPPITS